ncbi:sarcosine oxidase subunit gamma [Mameliella sediminis]|uniref:sarcosine oxidase subunit gamma n=1 Tax=Mameliella sediminis TaxID=2836866 RepID=UPI001C47EEEC|nr:sarcosine oxidase subunit gamma [Mameliella sediminis]
MHDLKPLTPLGATDPRVDSIGSVTLTEVTSVALASVAARLGHEEAARSALAAFIGGEVPAPSRHGGGALNAFWTGPDQWMVEAPMDTHEDLAHHLAEVLGADASVTEQTDAWCRFDLSGYELPSIMELLCPVDLRSWQGGEVQRTSIDHLGCFVLNRGPRALSVIGPRSSAGSLHHALMTACKSAA